MKNSVADTARFALATAVMETTASSSAVARIDQGLFG